uniref:Uncharacterized protein n=1 Tax=Pristionchus pacificus TaxID=54126 RepID=A0A2A6BLW8_PRIPA|eukprot:PDM66914.1 hypothetical protein PRIPAC_48331 [Pristionchus pacificus]
MERAAIVPADSQRVLESMGNGERAEEVLIASGKWMFLDENREKICSIDENETKKKPLAKSHF